MQDLADRPPRLFLRRLAALTLDGLAYLILFTLVMAAVATVAPSLHGTLSASAFFSRVCTSADADLPVFGAIESALEAGAERTRQVCTFDSPFLPEKRFAVVSEKRMDAGGAIFSRSISLQIDDQGNAVFPDPLTAKLVSALEILLFPLALALAAMGFGATPGKRLMSLAVTREKQAEKTPIPLSPAATLVREYTKFWPVCANALFQLAIVAGAPRITDVESAVAALAPEAIADRALVDMLVLNATTLFVLLVWWVLPFVFWRGRTLYDGFIRCYVVRRG